MRFWLLDTIDAYESGVRLEASKQVTYSEEYLQDHFPEFPVLPGVFMLEAATQASAWLLRLTEDYAHSVISLKEAKNIKYADFVRPGSRLTVAVELLKREPREATLKVSGEVTDRAGEPSPTLSGRIVVERYNLADDDPAQAEVDAQIVRWLKTVQQNLRPPLAAV